MKVKKLMELLENENPEMEIAVSVPVLGEKFNSLHYQKKVKVWVDDKGEKPCVVIDLQREE